MTRAIKKTLETGSTNPVTVLWHPSAASEWRAQQFLDVLRAKPGFEVLPVSGHHELRDAIAERMEEPGVIVAAGGDGTVRNAVSALMDAIEQGKKQVADLGVFPLGTGNDLARTLGIPFDAVGAVETLLTGSTVGIDVVECQTSEGRFWSGNMVTGGNTGKYMESMTDEIKERWGAFSYFRGILDVVKNIETFSITVRTPDETKVLNSALNLFIANGRTSGGGMVVAPDASLESGQAHILILEDGDPGDIIQLTAAYFLSDYRQHPLVHVLKASQAEIIADPPIALTADGDLIGMTPLTITLHHQALRVRVPHVF